MPTVEAVYLNGTPMLLEDCEIVGDVMAKIAISRDRFATHILIIDPANGRQMAADDIQIPKVEFVILNEEDLKMDREAWKLNLRLHAAQADDATCSKLLATLRKRDSKKMAGHALSDVLFGKKNMWSVAAGTMLRLGVSTHIPLQKAARVGRVDVVQFLAPDLVDRREFGCWLLGSAAWRKDAEMVRTLLDAGADVNAYDNVEDNAVYWASFHGCADILKMLLGAGADVNGEGAGSFALLQASSKGYVNVAKMLLDAGADANSTQPELSADIVKCLLATGLWITFGGESALYKASGSGCVEIVKMLVDAGADVNINKYDVYDSPLYVASCNGNTEIVKMLLDAGADINTENLKGKAALDVAFCGNTEIVKMLLDAGAAAQ